jgi:transposase-like protein
MAILGPEGVYQVSRASPVHLDMRTAYVDAPVARALGLHDGQVVQATAALRQDQLKLTLNEHVFNLPLSPYIKEGDVMQLRAHLLPTGQWTLQLLHTGRFAGVDPATGAPVPAQPSRLNTLLFQPGGFTALMSLMQPGMLESLLPAGSSELKERIKAQRLSMASLQPQTLRRWVLQHGKSGEASLAEGAPVESDVKALLRLIMADRARVGAMEGGDTEALQHAVDEAESAQLQAAQDWHKGELNLAFVIPFKDADPLEMRFERRGNQPGQPKNPLVVNMHTQSRVLGEVWLKTTISENAHVDLTMWALKEEVAAQARFNASELTYELESAGLVMGSFQVYNAARPDVKAERAPPPHGALIDTQA